MKGTKLFLATIVVIGAAMNLGVQGFPQGIAEPTIRTIVDGFAFDGLVDGRLTNSSPRPTPRPSRRPPIVGPSFSTQQPVVSTTSAPTTLRPDIAQCVQNCQVTPEYNPVCGSDGNMYSNNGLLNCVRNCGTNVTLSRIGRCTSRGLRG